MARDARVVRSTPESQAQSTSAEQEQKDDNRPQDSDEIEFFDTTITKIVTDPETGEEYEVMSDNLYPGERLKRDVEDERVKEKEDKARQDAENGDGDDRRYQR